MTTLARLQQFSPGAPAADDPLSDAVDGLRLRAWLPGRFELTAPWGLQVATPLGWFYLVLRHECELEVNGADAPVRAVAGDLLLVFPGRRHALRDRAGSPCVSIQNLIEMCRAEGEHGVRLRRDGGGTTTELLCGCFLLEESDPLTDVLPAHVRVAGQGGRAVPHVAHLADLLELEAAAPADAGLLSRLVRLLLVVVLRAYAREPAVTDASWLRALANPEIGRALGLMHARPEVPWTIAALAEQVAMSRSNFASRFVGLVGRPPLEYLCRCRMRKACQLLRTTRLQLKEIATRVGYESASGFSRAFVHATGTAPGSYRRVARSE